MSEERKPVLEMLSEGKLTVDEAERLLSALDDGPSGSPDVDREDDDDGFDPLDDLGEEIRAGMAAAEAGIAEAEAVVREVVPGAVKGAERIVRSVIRSRTRNRRRSRHRGAREEAVRQFSDSRPFEPGATLSVRNAKGDVRIETWDRSEIAFDAEIVALARTVEEAEILADSVEIDVLSAEDGLRLESSLPNEQGELRGSWVTNFRMQIPSKADLDIESRHGDTRIAEVDGDVAARNAHGHTSVGDVSGALRLRHSHGNVTVDGVGSEAAVDVRHGNLTLKETVEGLALRNQHGNASVGPVGKDLDLFSAHTNTTVTSVGGCIEGRLRHTEFHMEKNVQESVVLDASHGAFRGRDIGGDLTVTVRHGSVVADRVEGAVAIDGSHSPIEIRHVGRDASVKSSHARVSLGTVGGSAIVDAKHSPVRVSEVKGETIVNGSHGPVELEGVASAVTVNSKQGPLTIRPAGPINEEYRISNHGGPVDLTLPVGSDVTVEGSVKRGKARCDHAKLAVTATGKRSSRISGQLLSGAARVLIEVDSGDLHIRDR